MQENTAQKNARASGFMSGFLVTTQGTLPSGPSTSTVDTQSGCLV